MGKAISLLKLPAFAAAIGVAVQAVIQLAGAAVALAGALGPLVGLTATLANTYVALGQVMGVLKLAGFDQLTKAMQGDKEAFKQLTPEAKKFGATLKGLEGRFKGLKKAVQGELFLGLTKGLQAAMGNFGRFKAAMSGMAATVGDAAARIGKILGSKSFGKLFSKVANENEQIVGRLAKVLGHLTVAFFNVLVAARPLTDWLTKAAVAWSKNTEEAAKAGRKSGEMAKFFEHTRQILSKVWKITSNFTHALVNLGSIGRKTGMDLFGHMNRAAKSFRAFTESASGKNEIKQWFDDIKPGVVAIGRLLNTLTKAFIDIGDEPGLKKTADSLGTSLVPALTKVFKSLNRVFTPALIESISQIARLFARITKYTAPFIALGVKGIGALAKGLNALIRSSPVLKTIAGGLAAIIAVQKGVAVASFLARITGLRSAWMLLTTSLFRTRIAYAALIVQEKAAALASLASTKVVNGLKTAMFALGNTTVVLRARLMAMAVLGKVTAALQAVKLAVLGLSLTVRGAMMATGIGALIVGATLIVMHWDKVKVALAAAWNWIKNAAVEVGKKVLWMAQHGLLGTIPLIISRWKDVKNALAAVWGWLKTAAKAAWGAVKTAASTVFDWFKKAVKTYFQIITWPYRQAWKVIKAVFGFIIDAARDAIHWVSSKWDTIQNVLTAPFRFVKDVVKDIFNWVIDKADDVIDKIGDIVDKAKDVGSYVVPGGTHGLGSDDGVLGIPGVPGIATGGMVTATGVDYFARGGVAGHPGKPKGTDTVPAWLTPGEAVISKPAVDAAGGAPAMRSINSGAGLMGLMGLNPAGIEEAVKRITSALTKLRATQKTTVFGMAGETEGRTRTMNEAIASNFVNGQRAAEKRSDEMRKNVVDRISRMEKAAHAKTKKMAKNTKDDAKKMKESTKDATGAAADSWESLGGGIDKFQKKAGRDIGKHKKDVKKDTGDISSLLTTVAGVAWGKYAAGVATAGNKGDKEIKNHHDKTKGFLDDIVKKGKDAVTGWLGYAKGTTRHMREVTQESKNQKNNVLESQGSMIDGVSSGLSILATATNKALKAFGVKPVNFGVDKSKPEKKQHGGVLRANKGAIVPGTGSGDKVPLHIGGSLAAMVEPGELVSVNNRTSTAKLMAHNSQNKRGAQHLANGGVVGKGEGMQPQNLMAPFDVDGSQPGFVPFMNFLNSMFGPIYVMSGFRGGSITTSGNVSNHASGHAVDISTEESGVNAATGPGGSGPGFDRMDALHSYMAQNISLPGDFLWRTFTGGNHYNHIHRGITSPEADDPRLMVEYLLGLPSNGSFTGGSANLPEVSLTGPEGALLDLGNASLAATREAAMDYLSKQSSNLSGGSVGYVDGGGGPVVSQMGNILTRAGFSRPGAAGIIGNAYRESLWDPASVGTGGGGLFGFTTGSISLASLQAFADKQGKPWTDVGLQMQFMMGAPGGGGLVADDYYNGLESFLKSTDNVHDATYRFMDEWERPGVPAFEDRLAGAQKAMQTDGWQDGGVVAKLAKGGALGIGDIRSSVNHYAQVGAKSDKQMKPGKRAKKQKKILTKLLDKITGLENKDGSYTGGIGGIQPGLSKKLGGLENNLLMYDENAQRAADVTSLLTLPGGDPMIDPETGYPMQAKIDSKTQVEWLEKKLEALWAMRNALIRANKQIEKRKTAIEKLIKQSTRAYNNAMKKVEKIKKQLAFEGKDPGDKYKGKLNPFDAAVGKWNAQKDEQRAKLAGTFQALGGKLPGDRMFTKDFSLATPETDPKMFPNTKLEQSKADTLKKLVLPALSRQLGLTTNALPDTLRTLADVQGSYAGTDIVKGPVSVPDIMQNYGGQLLQTVLDIRDLDPSNDFSTTDTSSDLLDMYRQIAYEQTQRNTVLSSQMPIFNDFFGLPGRATNIPFGGVYHSGLEKGPIPGPRGSDVAIIAQAGEVVAQPDQMLEVGSGSSSSQQPVAVIIEDGAVDSGHIRTIFGEEAAKAISNSRRRIGR